MSTVLTSAVDPLLSPHRPFNEEARATMPAADLLFTGAAVFTGTGQPIHGHAVAVTGDRITAVVPEAEASALIGEHTRVERSTARCSAPASRTRTCTRSAPASSCSCATSPRRPNAEDAVATVKALRRREPRRGVDRRRRLVDGPLPGRRAGARAARRGRARPAGAAHEPRPPQRVGEHRGDRAGRARRLDPRPRRRPHRARGRRLPGRHVPRGRRAPVPRRAPAGLRRLRLRRPAARAGGAPRARHHRLAGRHRRRRSRRHRRTSTRSTAARSPRAPCAPTSSARSGGSATAASSRSRP